MTLSISSHNISTAQPATITAKIVDGGGVAVPNLLVTFATDSQYGAFSPASGTTLTDSSGVASMTLQAGSTSGAALVTVTANVPASTTTTATTLSNTISYLVSASASNTTISLSPISIGANPLSAYGTTDISVTVQATTNGQVSTYQPPTIVTFTSRCATTTNINKAPLASLSANVTTVNGIAKAQYRDNGCNSTDTISATIANVPGATASTNLVVNTPAIGSLQFVSASPSTITLHGTGGTGLGETSTVVFKVVDAGGNPIQANVAFSLSTNTGGITLTNATAISDPVTGLAQTIVNSGTIPTPVRVIAQTTTTTGTVLTTQSDVLSISTGLPDQAHFSLSADIHNIEGLTHDGSNATLTIRAADHFGNPVPDQTTINFVTPSGVVTPQCRTTGGSCQVTLSSQEPRTTNGRFYLLAYGVGESCFTDLNGNGLFDSGELVDVNGLSCSLGEAFVDRAQTGSYVAGTDPYIDFNQNGQYDGPDGLYHGSLCSAAAKAAGLCSTQTSLNVRQSALFVFSGSDPVLDLKDGTTTYITANKIGNNAITLAPCSTDALNVFIRDVNGNVLPANTTVTFATNKGSITSTSTYQIVDDTRVATASNQANFLVRLKDDGTAAVGGGCTPSTTLNGSLTITVTTPLKVTTTYSVPVTN
jgi:hypothetical protein